MSSLARQYNWLIHSIIDPAISDALKDHATGKLLDIGCGTKPYQQAASPYVTHHTGVDHSDSTHGNAATDISATAYSIPLDGESYDTILCTDVLEHLEEPKAALDEAYRILKTDGYAIYTVPLFWHLHEEPRDFFRYTKHGLKYLFENSGFKIESIQALSGFSATFSQELVYFLYGFRKGGIVNPLWWLVPPLGHLIQAIGFVLNKVERVEKFTCEYLVIARK